MKSLIAAAGMLLLLGTAPAFAQESCVPIPVGQDGVFFLKASDTCRASAYMTATDAEQTLGVGAIRDNTTTIDDYVLVSDLVSVQDNSRELMVLVRPFSFQSDLLGQVLAKAMRDGSIGDLGAWQDVSVQ